MTDAWQAERLRLKELLVLEDDPRLSLIRHVGGVDISFVPGDRDAAVVGYCVLEYPSMRQVASRFVECTITAPYVPGFLAFRECEHIVKTIVDARADDTFASPDVILVDGSGVHHPCGFGLASQIGVLTGVPTIGVAKKFLAIDGLTRTSAADHVRSHCTARDQGIPWIGESGRLWGYALTRNSTGSVFINVSAGHLISHETALDVVRTCSKHAIPEPIRAADLGSRDVIRRRRGK